MMQSTAVDISLGMVCLYCKLPAVQSQPKVVRTLELYHVSPSPPNQCWKISCFFQQKGQKSPDYQH